MHTKFYRVARGLKKDEKIAPQARVIIETIKNFGEAVDRTAVVSALESNKLLNTKQDVSKVFTFFRPQLVASGILKETTAAPKKSAPASGKPPRKRAKKSTKTAE
jgi:hypothetical protein